MGLDWYRAVGTAIESRLNAPSFLPSRRRRKNSRERVECRRPTRGACRAGAARLAALAVEDLPPNDSMCVSDSRHTRFHFQYIPDVRMRSGVPQRTRRRVCVGFLRHTLEIVLTPQTLRLHPLCQSPTRLLKKRKPCHRTPRSAAMTSSDSLRLSRQYRFAFPSRLATTGDYKHPIWWYDTIPSNDSSTCPVAPLQKHVSHRTHSRAS